jgi:hypothetical protein
MFIKVELEAHNIVFFEQAITDSDRIANIFILYFLVSQRRQKYTAHILRTNRVGSDKNHLYLDSGSSKHMVKCKSLIENFVKSLSPEIIEMADGRKITID